MSALTLVPVDQLEEMVEKQTPCDAQDGCLSKQELPGEWLYTHLGAQPGCSQILCERCHTAVRVMIETIEVFGHVFACKACHKEGFPKSSIIIRHI